MKELLKLIADAGFSIRVDETVKSSMIVYGNLNGEDQEEWHRRYELSNSPEFTAALRKLGLRRVNQMAWLRLNMPYGQSLPAEYVQAVAEFGAKKGELAAGIDILDLAGEAAHVLNRLRRLAASESLEGGDAVSGRALALVCNAEDAIEEFRAILER